MSSRTLMCNSTSFASDSVIISLMIRSTTSSQTAVKASIELCSTSGNSFRTAVPEIQRFFEEMIHP